MVTIGLTGGIGTGKSTVSRVLARAGATIIDAALVGMRFMSQAHQHGERYPKRLAQAYCFQISR